METRREIENIPVETRVLATQIQQLYTRLGMYGGGLFTQSSECVSLSLTYVGIRNARNRRKRMLHKNEELWHELSSFTLLLQKAMIELAALLGLLTDCL